MYWSKGEGNSQLNGTLEAHGLVQHVVAPTHKKGHTLDVVITRDISSLLIGMPTVSEPCLGDTKGNPSIWLCVLELT